MKIKSGFKKKLTWDSDLLSTLSKKINKKYNSFVITTAEILERKYPKQYNGRRSNNVLDDNLQKHWYIV